MELLDNEKTENENKKNYLYQYRVHVRRIKRIESELAEIRSMKMNPSVVNDGMPHGGGQNDLSGYASDLDRLERNLQHERYRRIKAFTDISKRILWYHAEG